MRRTSWRLETELELAGKLSYFCSNLWNITHMEYSTIRD